MENFVVKSSIHGIDYIFSRVYSKATKIFWSISFLLSIAGFSFYLYEAYVKLNLEPDIILKSSHKQMREVPFPALTVCTPLVLRSSIIEDIHAKFNLTTKKSTFAYIANKLRLAVAEVKKFEKSNYTANETIHYLNISSFEVDELFKECSLHLEYFPCTKMFRKVLTDSGFCYTFNMQGFGSNFSGISDEFSFYKYDTKIFWSIDRGYFDRSDELTPPVRASKKNLLMFSLHMNNSDAKNSDHILKSYSWSLHLPNELLTPFHKMHSLSFNQMKKIELTAKRYRSEEALKAYRPEIRRCYFENERTLKYFPFYTKHQCDYECVINQTLENCDCVKFSMPHDNTSKLCELKRAYCYFDTMNEWPMYDPNDENHVPCNCFPTCNDIKYFVETEFDSVYDLGASKNLTISKAVFVINDHSMEEYQNIVAYKIHNFISDFGGLLGLFIGSSILSLIEVFYFVFKSITSCCIRISKRKKMRATTKIQKIQVKPVSENLN